MQSLAMVNEDCIFVETLVHLQETLAPLIRPVGHLLPRGEKDALWLKLPCEYYKS